MPAGGGSFAKGRIVVIDPTPTGDFFLERALADFIAAKRPPRARGWINGRRPALPREYLGAAGRPERCDERPDQRGIAEPCKRGTAKRIKDSAVLRAGLALSRQPRSGTGAHALTMQDL